MQDTCENCKYFAASKNGQPGECRRQPPSCFPVMAGNPSSLARPGPQQAQLTFVGAHPPVMTNHWCGEHRGRLVS